MPYTVADSPILCHADSARIVDLPQTLSAITADSSQNDADGTGSEVPSDAAEQRIGSRPHAPQRSAPDRVPAPARPAPAPTRMWKSPGATYAPSARIGIPCSASTTRRWLCDGQPVGQAPGELRRHVLHDEHRGVQPGRQLGYDLRREPAVLRWMPQRPRRAGPGSASRGGSWSHVGRGLLRAMRAA